MLAIKHSISTATSWWHFRQIPSRQALSGCKACTKQSISATYACLQQSKSSAPEASRLLM